MLLNLLIRREFVLLGTVGALVLGPCLRLAGSPEGKSLHQEVVSGVARDAGQRPGMPIDQCLVHQERSLVQEAS